MLINLSNHTSSKWSKKQLDAAKRFGKVIDMPFPNVDPSATSEEIVELVKEYSHKIDLINEDTSEDVVIHIMGEMSFVVAFVAKTAYDCLCSTTERKSVESVNTDGSTTKTMLFEFIQFRAMLMFPSAKARMTVRVC